MIKHLKKNVDSMCVNGLNILAVYMRGRLIWLPKDNSNPHEEDPIDDIILSCYYNGYWIDEYPWTDDTPWTD